MYVWDLQMIFGFRCPSNNSLFQIGTPIHEFMHALGMGHTHTRSDRDQFIIVDFNNIQVSYNSSPLDYFLNFRTGL